MKLAKETRKIWGVRRPRRAAALTSCGSRECSHAFFPSSPVPLALSSLGCGQPLSFLRMMIETHHYRPEPKPQGYWRQTYAPL